MEHFKHERSSNVNYVPLSKIAISRPIGNAVTSLGGQVPGGTKIDSSAPSFGKLARLENFNNFMENTYPPVVVSPIGKTGYYSIVDGRHRVALSIVHNMKTVPCTFI